MSTSNEGPHDPTSSSETKPSTSSSEPSHDQRDAQPQGAEEGDDEPKSIEECMASATRFFALKQYSLAAEQASFAAEAIEKKHGEMSKESVDALMLLGKASLQNAIAQSAVLGGGGGQAEQTEEAVQQAVAGPSTSSANPAASWKFSFGGDAEEEEEEGGDEEGEDGEEEGNAAVDRDEELEGAYAAFDLVRAIWSKQEGEEAQIKVAEALRMCGEVERESEKFDLAIKEYESALEILTSTLPPSNRTLSELHMLIALAYDMIPDSVPKAVHHAEQSKGVLHLRLKELEAMKEKDDRTEREITDIRELIGELEEKIEDLKFVPEEAPKTEAEKHIDEMLKSSRFADAIKSGQVNNLNSLVKKKKPTTGSTSSASVPPNVPVIEEGAPPIGNGDAAGAGAKRKLDAAEEAVEVDESKKAKVDA